MARFAFEINGQQLAIALFVVVAEAMPGADHGQAESLAPLRCLLWLSPISASATAVKFIFFPKKYLPYL